MAGKPAFRGNIRLLSLALGLAVGLGACASAWALIISVTAPPVLSISDETGAITLAFTDFAKGTESSTQVAYRIRANNMAPGNVAPAVTASLVSPFEMADLEVDVSGYTNRGNSQHATLAETHPGFVPIQAASPTVLAEKRPGQGDGDPILNGVLLLTFRARLKDDTPAGSESGTVILTVTEGN